MANPTHITRFGLRGIDRIPYGLHTCHFYSNRDQLVSALVPYFVAGLDGNERCLWITAPPLPVREATDALRDAWSGVDDALRSGALRILDFDQWYAGATGLKGPDVVQLWLSEEERALNEGYNGLRIAGNTSFLKGGDWAAFMEYERIVTAHFKNRRIVALCSYAVAQCNDQQKNEVLHSHHGALHSADDNYWTMVYPENNFEEEIQRLLKAREEDGERSHEDLQKREKHFQDMIDALPVAIYTTDAQGRLTHFNPAAVEFSGRVPALGVDEWCVTWKLFHSDGTPMPHNECPMAVALKEGRIVRGIDAIAERPDGTRLWFMPYPTPLRNAEGNIVGGINMLVDITDRKRDEEAKARLAAIVESSDDAIVSKNLNGIITSWNRGAVSIFGYTAQEAIGQPVTMLMPPDRVNEEPGILKRIRAGEKIDHYETIRRRKDGTLLNVSLTVSPIFDAAGHVIGASKIARDITDRKRAEAALRASEEEIKRARDYAEATLRTSPVPLLVLENDLRVHTANEAFYQTFQVNPAETQGRLVYELGHGQWNIPQLRTLLETILPQNTQFRNFEVTHDFQSIGHRTMLLNARRMDNGLGAPERIVLVIEDMTDRKRAEEDEQQRLHRWNVELERAVNIKTVELRQFQERLRALTTELNLTEQRERQRIATELHDHLQQLLVLGRIKLGQGKRLAATLPEAAKLMREMDEVMAEALTYTRTLVTELSPPVLRDQGLAAGLKWLPEYMRKHDLNVTVAVPDEDLTLPQDRLVLVFQSVRELLINSSKHAGTGQATVAMDHRDNLLRIEVRDEGAGFDSAAAATHGESSDEGISSKFGLFSIRERMLALGGSFDIHSVLGKGTKATLVLPLRTREEATEISSEREKEGTAQPVSADLPSSTAKRIRVLWVDDHVMVRQGLRSVLDNYTDVELIGEAGNGEEAVALVNELRPDVVVMDISMPKMDGVEATKLIKAEHPETIIIGLSVNVTKENEEAMMRAGAVRLMTKEAAVEQLYETLCEHTVKESRSSRKS